MMGGTHVRTKERNRHVIADVSRRVRESRITGEEEERKDNLRISRSPFIRGSTDTNNAKCKVAALHPPPPGKIDAR